MFEQNCHLFYLTWFLGYFIFLFDQICLDITVKQRVTTVRSLFIYKYFLSYSLWYGICQCIFVNICSHRFGSRNLSILSKIMVLIPLSTLLLFSLIELSDLGVFFNLSKAILISLSDSSWNMIDIVNKCYGFTLCSTAW